MRGGLLIARTGLLIAHTGPFALWFFCGYFPALRLPAARVGTPAFPLCVLPFSAAAAVWGNPRHFVPDFSGPVLRVFSGGGHPVAHFFWCVPLLLLNLRPYARVRSAVGLSRLMHRGDSHGQLLQCRTRNAPACGRRALTCSRPPRLAPCCLFRYLPVFPAAARCVSRRSAFLLLPYVPLPWRACSCCVCSG